MKWTPKDEQDSVIKGICMRGVEEFEAQFPTKTINHHHYIRRRHMEQFLYDYTVRLLRNEKLIREL